MWRVIGSLSSSPLSWISCRCVVCPFPSFLSLMCLYRTYTRMLLKCRSVFCLLCFLEGGQVGHNLPFLFHWTQHGAAFSLRKFWFPETCSLFLLRFLCLECSALSLSLWLADASHLLRPAHTSSSNDKPLFPLIFQVYLDVLWGHDIVFSIEDTIEITYSSIVISYFWECLVSPMSHL